jgi:hypothetical protein
MDSAMVMTKVAMILHFPVAAFRWAILTPWRPNLQAVLNKASYRYSLSIDGEIETRIY